MRIHYFRTRGRSADPRPPCDETDPSPSRHRGATSAEWTGPDALRPLDSDGERSAELLAKLLADYRVRRLVSSPTTRCIQRLGLLAELCDLPIELWDGLGPDADPANIVRCFSEPAFADAVFCTHGEVVSPLLDTPTFRTCRQRLKTDPLSTVEN